MLINKRGNAQIEELLGEILDAQESDMIVVRGADCKVLFMSKAAREHLESENLDTKSCKKGYASIFRGLCDKCPNECPPKNPGEPCEFDVEAETGRIISVTGATITWVDKSPAIALFLRDVNDVRANEKKLYSLAYADQLTGVPNRQKLMEDCEGIGKAAESGKCGIVAIFDLDNFKSINDTYGHNTGDVMLRKITEHLQDTAGYKGHLYRLGGDEFVLFYMDYASEFKTDDDMRAHYEELLAGAFFSYTLPNIELSCTISMGVALFPAHGATISDMLRKADIALYKAKAEGRNRMIFFEDRYDAAKKFKNYYINIQPILADRGHTYGYELIDSGNEQDGSENSLNLNEFDRALDALGLDEIGNDARYFLTYSTRMVNKSVLNNLPKDKFIIQIHVPEKYTKKDLELYKELRSHGYSLAFKGLTGGNAAPELLREADYCKFEPDRLSPLEQKKIIADNPKQSFVAMNIDTREAYDYAKNMGFKLFQGLFFNQPVVVKKAKDVEPLKANYFRLLKLTSTDDYVDFSQISDVIASDVALSYKLLRLLNSAAVGLRNRISSIPMAVSYLGEESLKKWIALLSLRGVASDKPLELVRLSMIRAQFGELLAPHLTPKRNSKHVFLTGMLSLLHIALEKTKEELLEEIPVAEDIRESLLTGDGVYSDLIAFFNAYEYSNWDEVTRFADENHLSNQIIYDSYIAAVKWYNDLADS